MKNLPVLLIKTAFFVTSLSFEHSVSHTHA